MGGGAPEGPGERGESGAQEDENMYSKVLICESSILNCTSNNGTVKYVRFLTSGFWKDPCHT